jgi:hypothetical protein
MKRTLKVIALVLLLISNAGCALDPFVKGYNAYASKDYETALREFRPVAEQGDARAQFGLGLMYHEGQGVAQDYEEAMKWYRLAAEQGDAGAQNNLGVMYEWGHGVMQDYIVAIKWYRLAAEQGQAEAKSNLTLLLAKEVIPDTQTVTTTPTVQVIKSATSLDDAKVKCADLGFTESTEKFGECVLKLSK